MKNSTLKFANGDKYEGELKGKKKHGYGVFTWADGSTFRGDWKDDKKHGHATFVDVKGVELSGYWKNGEFEQIANTRTDQKIDLNYLKKKLNLKNLIKYLDKKTPDTSDLNVYYDFLKSCSTKINNKDKLFDEINSHEEKLYDKFDKSFSSGTFLPLVNNNFKLIRVRSIYGPELTEHKQHSYTHQIVHSKINKVYYILVYRGFDYTNNSYISYKKFKDKKLAINFVNKEQKKLLIKIHSK